MNDGRNGENKMMATNATPNASTMPNASTLLGTNMMSGTNTIPGTSTVLGTNTITGVPPEKLHEIASHVRSVADGLARTLMAASTLADSLQALINDMPTKAGHDQMRAARGAEAVQATSLDEQAAPPMEASIPAISAQDSTQGSAQDSTQGSAQDNIEASTQNSMHGSAQASTAHPSEPISLVDLRAYVAARSTPDKRPKIREALLKYGVKRLTDLAPTQYAAFKAEVDAL